MVIEVLYKSFRYEKFDSSAQTNSEPFRAKGTNILTDWNLYLAGSQPAFHSAASPLHRGDPDQSP